MDNVIDAGAPAPAVADLSVSREEALELQALELRGQLAASKAEKAALEAEMLAKSFVDRFRELCARLGIDPHRAAIDYATGKVSVR